MSPKRFIRQAAALAVICLTVVLALAAPASAEPSDPTVTINIQSPMDGAAYKSTPSLLFSTHGIGSKQCSVDDGEPRTCISGWKPASLSDGRHTYTAFIESADASNSATDSVSFILDSKAPVITITGTPTGSYSNALNVNLSATVTDANPIKLECRYPGVDWTICGTSSGKIEFNGIAQGTYGFDFRATDVAGHQTTVGRVITFDRTAPAVEISTNWGDKTYMNTPYFNIASYDASPTTRNCRIVGRTEWVACDGNSWAVAGQIADGVLSAEYRVEDSAGNVSTATFAFEIDSTRPSVTVNPLDNDRTTATTPTLSFQATDVNGVTSKCAIDTADWNQLTDCNGGSFTVPTTLAVGSHSFWVMATDGFGNGTSVFYNFAIVELTLDPGTGGTPNPGSDDGATAAKVTLAAKSGRVSQGKFVSTIRLSVKPVGTVVASSCRAKVSLVVKVGRKSIKKSVALKQQQGVCVGVTKLKLPRSLKGKKAAVRVRFAGNPGLAAFSHVGSLRKL